MKIHVLVCPGSGLMFDMAFNLVDSLGDAEIFICKKNAEEMATTYGKHINNRIEVKSFNVTPV